MKEPAEVTIAHLIQSVGAGSLENDKALLQLCEALIGQINELTEYVRVHTQQIDKLHERHEALLLMFYKHCQDVARIDPREMN